jgi:hypothetical protein
MPAVTVPKGSLAFGAGALYSSDLGAGAAPANTIVGSVFTDNWGAGWNLLGVSREGHTLNINFETEAVEAAEYLDPLLNVVTSRNVGIEVDLMQVNLTMMKRVFNGGTKTTSGAGSTLLTTYTLPKMGQEVRCQLGWEGTDFTERWWGMQCFQVGEVGIQRQKGANNASLPVTFNFEPDASGEPIYIAGAGATRA